MKIYRFKTALLTLCFLLAAPLAGAEEPLFGEVTGVDTVSKRIYLSDGAMLELSTGSRILDMEGNRMSLLDLKTQLEKAHVSETERIGGLVPYVNFTVVERQGTILLEEMQLTEAPH